MSDKKVEAPDTIPSDKDTLIASAWRLMHDEASAIQYYIVTVAFALNRELKEFDGLVARWATKVPERRQGAFYESASRSQLAFYLTQHFPEFTWQATFVAIYSFLEDQMLGICRIVAELLVIKTDPDDLRDEGIRAAKKYLDHLCGITFPEEKHPWQEVLHYNIVRNAIIHARGCVDRAKNAEKIRN